MFDIQLFAKVVSPKNLEYVNTWYDKITGRDKRNLIVKSHIFLDKRPSNL